MRPVSFGMYDSFGVAPANDALWAWLEKRLRTEALAELPLHLDRSRPAVAIVQDPALLLGHTCGYPLMTSLRGKVQLVAIPKYNFLGCSGALYRSFLLVAEHAEISDVTDLRGKIAAVNGPDSNSGMNLLRAMVAPHAASGRFFARLMTTGSHAGSIAAVVSGSADVAATDCVTYGLIARHEPHRLAGTRILAWTETTPGLPLVTGPSTTPNEIAALRRALLASAEAPELAETREALGLAGFEILDLLKYERILDLESGAAALGYPTLA